MNSHLIRLSGILALTACLLCGCSRQTAPVSRTAFYFDTVITITLYDPLPQERSQELLDGCFSLCQTYEAMLSCTVEGSDIWKINHAKGRPTKVTPQTAELLQKALSYCRQTDGLVDITIAPLSALWDFSSESLQTKDSAHVIPSAAMLQELLPHVDYRKVQISDTLVTLEDPEAAIDLGCIAKGYIADQLKAYLTEQGCRSALINLGGNLLAVGSKPDGSAFRLGIQKPFAQDGTPIATLSVTDSSLVSSGVYERYFRQDGSLYHHLLNPHTGMPENNGLLSVTILSDSSKDGDILSTACFLLGPEQGMDYIEALPGIEAVFVTEDGSLHPSSGLSGLLQTP